MQYDLQAWYTEDELEQVRLAAAAAGMAPAAWLLKLGTSAAEAAGGGRARVLAADQSDMIAAISDATALARRLSYRFNEAVAKLSSTGEHFPGLEHSAAILARAVRRMESAALRAARALR